MSSDKVVAAHDGKQSHRAYIVHFPPHPARTGDPHYVDFNHYHQQHRPTARCFIGERVGYDGCMDAQGNPCPPDANGFQPGLELHHAHIEFSMQAGVSLDALEKDYPGISDPATVGAWVESGANFRFLCVRHHRGEAGAHSITHSDWEGSQYVANLIGGIK